MFSTDNLSKPANKRWKFWSKFLTRTLPVYATVVAAIPSENLDSNVKTWIITGLSLIVATISGLSEYTTEETA